MRAAVLAVAPAVAVAGRGEGECFRLPELYTTPALDLHAESVKPVVLDRVLQARVLAVGAVAPIALDRHHRFADRECLLRPAIAYDVSGARIGIGLAVGHAHTASDRDVVAGEVALLVEDRDIAKIVREHVD